MKKRLPIKGWQWRERLKKLRVEKCIIVHGESEKVAVRRAARNLGFSIGTSSIGDKIWCWIISKKGKGK